MHATMRTPVLIDTLGPSDGTALRIKQVVLVLLGIAVLAVCAKIRIPMWPVPVTMGTFGVLAIGAAYGPRLGLTTLLGYLAVGALGFNVFAGSSATENGLSYMMGTTGGYLVGYVLAAGLLGMLARRGWDRDIRLMAAALLLGNIAIYVPGLFWLGTLLGWDQPILTWGLTPFLIGDALKLALAALVLPALWSMVGTARR